MTQTQKGRIKAVHATLGTAYFTPVAWRLLPKHKDGWEIAKEAPEEVQKAIAENESHELPARRGRKKHDHENV